METDGELDSEGQLEEGEEQGDTESEDETDDLASDSSEASSLDTDAAEIAVMTDSLQQFFDQSENRRASRRLSRRARRRSTAVAMGQSPMPEESPKASPAKPFFTRVRSHRKSFRASTAKRRGSFRIFSSRFIEKAVGPAVRDRMHQLRVMSMGWKEKASVQTNQWFSQFVTALDVPDPTQAIQATTTAARLKHEQRRCWAEARAAAHRPHAPEDDEEIRAPDRRPDPGSTCPRGFLEVEVLAFGSDPPLVCADGNAAQNPVCQFTFGDRCSGGLQPWASGGGADEGWLDSSADASQSARLLRRNSSRELESDSETAPRGWSRVQRWFRERRERRQAREQRRVKWGSLATQAPAEAKDVWSFVSESLLTPKGVLGGLGEASREVRDAMPHRACFAVNEVSGSDLRLHVFDVASPRFAMGLEESAFCGGALVPLSVLHHRRRSCSGPLRWSCEAKVGVKLLPLELMANGKLATLQKKPKSMRNDALEVGVVLLRLRFHSQAHPIPRMLLTRKFLGISRTHAEAARVDQPMSVVICVFKSLQRVKAAMDFAAYRRAANELRDSPASCAMLLTIWTYAALFATLWQLAWCLALALVLFVRKVSILLRHSRLSDSPRMFIKESQVEEFWNLREQGKQGIKKAVTMEMSLVRFARNCNKVARQLERISHVISLRDPCLTAVCGVGTFAATMSCSVMFFLLSLVPCRMGVPLVVWASGCLMLVPQTWRERIIASVIMLKSLKVRAFGPGRLLPTAQALWTRIPDRQEADHWELFERRLLLP